MSNLTKAFIAVLAPTLLISGVVLSKNIGSVNLPNPNVSTSSSSLMSSSPNSTASSSSQINSSSVQTLNFASRVIESSKVETPVVDRGSNSDPIQDIPNVTKLSTDKSIYWQYIRDYLACPTKFYQPLNGGYIYEGLDQYQYLCIPQSEIDKCPKGILGFGFEYFTGNKVPVTNPKITQAEPTIKNPSGQIKELETIMLNKYFCTTYAEGVGSVSLPYNYYQQYFPDNINEKIPGYFTIPKVVLPTKKNPIFTQLSFAAIPFESFSTEDQQYIAKNFNTK
jgi:hypothetical protein